MARRSAKDIRDLPPAKWRRLGAERNRMPVALRQAFVAELREMTGLSRASVFRRLDGQFPGKRRKGVQPRASTKEQRALVFSALDQAGGAISAARVHRDVLGSPVEPSVRTVARLIARWRLEQLRERQLSLPLGADRPTSFAELPKSEEALRQAALSIIRKVVGAW